MADFLAWLSGSNGVVLIAALLAATVTVWGVFSQRTIASRRTTIEFVQRSLTDKDMISARSLFIAEAKKPAGLAEWANPQHQGSKEAQAILTVLNEYELVAIGIQSGIVDLGLYKKWNKSTACSDWGHVAPFVFALRNQHNRQTLFIEFEDLVAEMGGRIRHKRNYFWAKIF